METTGDRQYVRDVRLLLFLLTALAWVMVYVAASGAIAETDGSLPPCGSGNYLAGTCQPDETGMQ